MLLETIDYTFGSDEIAQTVREFDENGSLFSEETLVFGHDGHGSVRVLYSLAGAIAQVATYAAYGNTLSVHNGAGQLVGTSEADFLSSLGYSGEQFDAATQQQYLRARYYDPTTGRFNRLDPYSGNNQDPQSLHKYAYVHGDPINGIDPSGLSLVGLAGSAFAQVRVRLANAVSVLRRHKLATTNIALAQNALVTSLALINIALSGGRPDAYVVTLGWSGAYLGWAFGVDSPIVIRDGKIYGAVAISLGVSPLSTSDNHAWGIAGLANVDFTIGAIFNSKSNATVEGYGMNASIPAFLLTSKWLYHGFLTQKFLGSFFGNLSNVATGRWQRGGYVSLSVSSDLKATTVSIGPRGFGWSATAGYTYPFVEIGDLTELYRYLSNDPAANPGSIFAPWIVELWDRLQRVKNIV